MEMQHRKFILEHLNIGDLEDECMDIDNCDC